MYLLIWIRDRKIATTRRGTVCPRTEKIAIVHTPWYNKCVKLLTGSLMETCIAALQCIVANHDLILHLPLCSAAKISLGPLCRPYPGRTERKSGKTIVNIREAATLQLVFWGRKKTRQKKDGVFHVQDVPPYSPFVARCSCPARQHTNKIARIVYLQNPANIRRLM